MWCWNFYCLTTLLFFGLLMCDSGDLHLHISKFIYMSVVTLLFTCSVHCNLSSIKNDVFIWKYFENALASAGSDTILKCLSSNARRAIRNRKHYTELRVNRRYVNACTFNSIEICYKLPPLRSSIISMEFQQTNFHFQKNDRHWLCGGNEIEYWFIYRVAHEIKFVSGWMTNWDLWRLTRDPRGYDLKHLLSLWIFLFQSIFFLKLRSWNF